MSDRFVAESMRALEIQAHEPYGSGARIAAISHRMRCIHPVARETLTLADGRTVALVEPIGRGTCGSVYRGIIESGWGIERPVAVKLFETPPEVDHGEVMRRLGRI